MYQTKMLVNFRQHEILIVFYAVCLLVSILYINIAKWVGLKADKACVYTYCSHG